MSTEPRRCPSQTPTRHSTSDSTELAPALNHWPSSARLSVCKLKEENVVYPPQIPSIKNCRNEAGASHRPSGPVAVANSPMTNEPVTFTERVPHGNVSPTRVAMNADAHHRARLPNPPPTKIHSAFHITSNAWRGMRALSPGNSQTAAPPEIPRRARH